MERREKERRGVERKGEERKGEERRHNMAHKETKVCVKHKYIQ